MKIKENYVLKSGNCIIGYAKTINQDSKPIKIRDLFFEEYNKLKVTPRLMMLKAITKDLNLDYKTKFQPTIYHVLYKYLKENIEGIQ